MCVDASQIGHGSSQPRACRECPATSCASSRALIVKICTGPFEKECRPSKVSWSSSCVQTVYIPRELNVGSAHQIARAGRAHNMVFVVRLHCLQMSRSLRDTCSRAHACRLLNVRASALLWREYRCPRIPRFRSPRPPNLPPSFVGCRCLCAVTRMLAARACFLRTPNTSHMTATAAR